MEMGDLLKLTLFSWIEMMSACRPAHRSFSLDKKRMCRQESYRHYHLEYSPQRFVFSSLQSIILYLNK